MWALCCGTCQSICEACKGHHHHLQEALRGCLRNLVMCFAWVLMTRIHRGGKEFHIRGREIKLKKKKKKKKKVEE